MWLKLANKRFLSPINLVNLSSDPGSASEGDIYYNTTDDAVKVYANSTWVAIGSGGSGSGSEITVSDTAPSSPATGDAWYKNDTGELYIWDGTFWVEVNGTVQVTGALTGIESIEDPDYITFDITPETSSSNIGTLYWNETEGTLDLKLTSEINLELGQGQYVRVHNGTESTIPAGTVVYVNGEADIHGHISVAPYIADGSVNVFNVMGLAATNISSGQDGYTMLSGLVRGLDTSDWTTGQGLFASDTTPGALTNVQPISPSETVSLGVVTVSDETDGVIFVQIDAGATADLVTYDNSTSNLIASNVAAAIDELALTKADINSLSSNLIVYPTTVESAISGYYRMVSSTDDADYNDTAVNVSTGNLGTTGSNHLISSLIADANLFVGTPGSINITTVGNIRKTSGNQNAFSEFFFRVYKRTSGGTETLLGTSSTTGEINPATLNEYEQFFASANCFITEFSATDRIVIKYYSNVLDDGTQSYEFQFGGNSPVRSLIPVPVSVIPSAEASGILVDTSEFNGVLSSSDSNVQAALETIDSIVEIPDQTGHNGDYLSTNGSVVEWKDFYEGVKLTAYNKTESTIAAFTPVYFDTETAETNEVCIAPADSDELTYESKMPAGGITISSTANLAAAEVVTFGLVRGMTLTGYLDDDMLYVASGGGLTKVKPTGNDAIQPFARVLSVENGTIFVYGNYFVSHTSTLPNLASDKIWLGTTGRPVETTLNTTVVAEGTNLYFTDERAQDATASLFSSGSHTGIGVEYVDSSGLINLSNTGVTALYGTTNEINVSASTGGVTISIPDSPVFVTPNIGVATATSINGTTIPTSETLVVSGDLSDYVTLTGTETLSNKTISDNLTLEGNLLFDVISGTPTGSIGILNGPGYNQLSINSSDWLNLSSTGNTSLNTSNGWVSISSADYVLISGTNGEFLNNHTIADNQIATIGNISASISSHNHTLDSLSNVVITGTPTDGQAIVWDTSTSKWVNETISAGDALPSQTGNDGKFLQTDGTDASWQDVDLSSYLTSSTAAYTYQPLSNLLSDLASLWGPTLYPGNLVITYSGGIPTVAVASATLQTATDGGATSSNAITISNTTQATDSTSGALIVSGGIGVAKDVWIDGDLYVNGTTSTLYSSTVATSDNLIYLNQAQDATITNAVGDGTYVTYTADNAYTPGMDIRVTGMDPSGYDISSADGLTIYSATSTQFVVAKTTTGSFVSGGTAHAKTEANADLGFAGGYYDAGYAHAGLFRDASDGVFKFFTGYTPEPDEAVNIDTTHASFALADISANNATFNGDLIINGGDITSSAATINMFDGNQSINIGNASPNLSLPQNAINIAASRTRPIVNIGNNSSAFGGEINIGGGSSTGPVTVTIDGDVYFPRGFTTDYLIAAIDIYAGGNIRVDGGSITSPSGTINLFNDNTNQDISIGSSLTSFTDLNLENYLSLIGASPAAATGQRTTFNHDLEIAGTYGNLIAKNGFFDYITVKNALPYSIGGTGLTTLGTAGQVLQVNSTEDAIEWATPSGGGGGGLSTTTTSITTNSAIAIESFAIATSRTAEAIIQITQGTDYYSSKVLLIHDDTNVKITEYAILESTTGAIPVTISAAISGSNLELLATVTDAASTNATAKVVLIEVAA